MFARDLLPAMLLEVVVGEDLSRLRLGDCAPECSSDLVALIKVSV